MDKGAKYLTMRKMISLLTAVGFLTTTTLNVTACGVGNGQKITTNFTNAPTKATSDDDPLKTYCYNDLYTYNSVQNIFVLATAAQLVSDELRTDETTILNGQKNNVDTHNLSVWKQFYNSQSWINGNFTSFNYSGYFAFKDSNSNQLIYEVTNNDASVDNNKKRIYWFSGSAPNAPEWSVPKLSEFKTDSDNITKTQVLGADTATPTTPDNTLNLVIGGYTISFACTINLVFSKLIDKSGIPLVVLSTDTFNKPFGTIDFNNPSATYNKVINKISIAATTK